MTLLEVENITKYFKKEKKGKVKVLDNINFSLNEGEIVGLLGPNGSGKTTLMRLIMGFYLPDKGDIKIYGESIFKNSKLIEKYVKLPFLIYDPRFSVYETLKLTGKFWGVKNLKEKIDYWLEYFDLKKEKDTQIQKLSTGNYQKLLIIGALLTNPKLLLLDEITNGLDIFTVKKLLDILKKINKEYKVSIIFSSHIFSHVEELCERIIIIYNGKILVDGYKENLLNKLKNKRYISIITKQELPNEIIDDLNLIKVKNTVYKIICDNTEQNLKKILSEISSNKELIKIIEDIKIKEPTLEDVFAYYVEKFKAK